MSLLNISRNVLAEVGWPTPSAIASNVDPTAQQVFALANTELRQLSELFSWPHLEVEHTFSTVVDQTTYFFPPDDFRVLAQQSLFDASEYYRLKGSVSIQDWHMLKYGLLGSLSRVAFRVTYPLGAPAIEITPAPNTIRNLVAVYYTKQLARNSSGDDMPQYVADDDVSKIPEQYVAMGLKWRFRRAKGLDFSVELAEYNATVRTQFAKHLSQAEIPVGGRRPVDGLTPGYVPDDGFGA